MFSVHSNHINELALTSEERIAFYCMFASAALLCYDCALTLPAEIERIWKRRVTGATLIYLFLRYATLFDCVLWCILESGRDNGTRSAKVGILELVCHMLMYIASALITVLRVYGISLRDLRAVIIVSLLASVTPVAYLVSQLLPNRVYDSDGLATGSYKYMILIANSIIRYTANQYSRVLVIWSCFDQVFTGIILTRFILQLRGIYLSDGSQTASHWDTSQAGNPIVFRGLSKVTSDVVGNLAAPIRTNNDISHDWEDSDGDEILPCNRPLEGSQSGTVRYSDDPFREGMMEE
ncbi:hypothetical protein C8Q74DRAFT_395231 [Fomes fomentarius]|nr:hypothetical protein C8Q74DRAFT_395231 [Fomes fomentarius]